MAECTDCHGTGAVEVERLRARPDTREIPCTACCGSGNAPCPSCGAPSRTESPYCCDSCQAADVPPEVTL